MIDGHIGWGVFAREVVPGAFMIEGLLGRLAGEVQVVLNARSPAQRFRIPS